MSDRPGYTPTSKIHQPSYPCDGHLPLSGSLTELKYNNSTWSTNKMLWSNKDNAEISGIDQYHSNMDIKKVLGVDTACLCCFMSFFLVFPALSTSADVSRPTVELSWLNNRVCPENSRFDQSLWSFVLGLPPQLPCPPFTLPMKQVLKQAPMFEYLWTRAAVTLWTWTSCCLLNVSWKKKKQLHTMRTLSPILPSSHSKYCI